MKLSAISAVQLQGDYMGKALDVYVDQIQMVKPTAQIDEARQKLLADLQTQADRQRQEAERLEKAKQEARDSATCRTACTWWASTPWRRTVVTIQA